MILRFSMNSNYQKNISKKIWNLKKVKKNIDRPTISIFLPKENLVNYMKCKCSIQCSLTFKESISQRGKKILHDFVIFSFLNLKWWEFVFTKATKVLCLAEKGVIQWNLSIVTSLYTLLFAMMKRLIHDWISLSHKRNCFWFCFKSYGK